MRASGVEEVIDRLRQMLRGNHSQVTALLEYELAKVRWALRDPSTRRSYVVEALHNEGEEFGPTPVDAAPGVRLSQLTRVN